MEIPKVFWVYYDVFRRKLISLEAFSQKTGLPVEEISRYLKEISKEA